MAVCNLCSTIPFSSLPPPSLPTGSSRIGDQDHLPVLWYDESEADAKDSSLGFKWHQDLDALAASAKICTVCNLVQKGSEAWLDRYNDVSKNNLSFNEFREGKPTIPSGQQLWLTKRFGGGPGFIVLVRSLKNRQRLQVILLAGVSFAVESGMYSKYSPQYCSRPLMLSRR